MKTIRYILLYFFLSSFLVAYGQSVEKTFRPDFYSTSNVIVPIGDNRILIGGEARNNIYVDRVEFLTLLDTLGNTLWEFDFSQYFPSHSKVAVKNILLLENGNFWVNVETREGCDYGFSDSYFRMTWTGVVLNHIQSSAWIMDLIQHEDLMLGSNIYSIFVLDDTLEPFDYTLDLFSATNPGFQVTDLDYSGSNLLLSSINNTDPTCGLRTLSVEEWGVEEYYISDQCVGYSNIQNIEHNEDGEIFLQNDNRIVVLDSNLNELTELLLADTVEILNFKVSDNKLIVISDSIEERSLKIYDQNLTLIYHLETEENLKLFPTDAFIKGNSLFVTGEERSKHRFDIGFNGIEDESSSSIFFRVYQMDSVNEFPFHDVGISQVSIAEFPVASQGWCHTTVAECGPSGLINYEDIYATITNYGNEVLNECTINAKAEPCGSCSPICARAFTFSKKYENLNLMPGTSIEVFFGDVEFDDQPHTAIHELCLWTANPNNLIDKNIDNDQGCYESELILDVHQLKAEQVQIEIYPNPSNSGKTNFSINTINEKKIIKIFDARGIEIANYFLEKNSNNLEIETSNFPSGIYYLMVETKSFTSGEKLVIY